MAQLKSFTPDTPHETLLQTLRTDGALILTRMIPERAVDELLAELGPFIAATEPGRDMFSGHKTTRTGALVARSARTHALIQHETVLALANALLRPFCERIQLHLTQVIRIMPGQTAQPIHRDRWAWGTHLKGIEPQVNTIWAVTDFTKDNGATAVAPGSIDWPDNRQPTEDEIAYAEMPRGSCIVYTGSVFHGGGTNITNRDRVGLNLTYSLAWLRQEENQYLSCPPEIARALSPELQALNGYAMGSYALGYYTPPLPAGQGPELVPPEYALQGASIEAKARLGDTALFDSIAAQVHHAV